MQHKKPEQPQNPPRPLPSEPFPRRWFCYLNVWQCIRQAIDRYRQRKRRRSIIEAWSRDIEEQAIPEIEAMLREAIEDDRPIKPLSILG